MSLLAFLLVGCNRTPEIPAAGAPVLHRLTEVQLNNSIAMLLPGSSVSQLDLPQDLAVGAFDNNAEVRPATPYLVETLQRSLIDVAAEAMDDPGDWLHCSSDGGADPEQCGISTLSQLTARAFRRPLTDEETRWITDQFSAWNAELGFSAAMQLSLQLILQSPDFLYLVEVGERTRRGRTQLTDWEVASRLSFFLWDAMPDSTLFQAAAEGRLSDPESVRTAAIRMLSDERAKAALVEFHAQWLDLDRIEDIDPDESLIYNEETDVELDLTIFRLSMAREFELYILGVLGGPGTLDALLTSRDTWASEELAAIYGAQLDTSRGIDYLEYVGGIDGYAYTMYPARLPDQQRAGYLTSAAFLSGHAHALQPSPVLRGVFVQERLLCLPPTPPPDDVPPLEETEAVDSQTNRERYAAHTENPACASCHVSIDGIGFTFENYDALGAWRDTDNGQPVDASGELLKSDVDGPLADAIDLTASLAASRQVHDCATLQWFRYAMHRSETDADAAAIAALQERFVASGGDIMNLLVDFVSSEAFLTRTEP